MKTGFSIEQQADLAQARQRAAQAREAREAKIRRAIRAGLSNSEASRRTGCGRDAVARVRREMEAAP